MCRRDSWEKEVFTFWHVNEFPSFFSPLFPLVHSCNVCLFVFHLLKDGEYISASLALQAHIHSNEKTGNVFEVTGLLCTFISTPWRGIYLIFSLASISTTSLPSLQPSNFTNTSSPYMFAFTRLLVLFSYHKSFNRPLGTILSICYFMVLIHVCNLGTILSKQFPALNEEEILLWLFFFSVVICFFSDILSKHFSQH